MYAPHPENMLESIKKVEATRAHQNRCNRARDVCTADEKHALLEGSIHPDYNPKAALPPEIKVGPNQGREGSGWSWAELLQATSRLLKARIWILQPDRLRRGRAGHRRRRRGRFRVPSRPTRAGAERDDRHQAAHRRRQHHDGGGRHPGGGQGERLSRTGIILDCLRRRPLRGQAGAR